MRVHPHPLRMGHADNGAVAAGCGYGGGCEEEEALLSEKNIEY